MRRDDQRLDDMLTALDWIAHKVESKTIEDFICDDTLWWSGGSRSTGCRS